MKESDKYASSTCPSDEKTQSGKVKLNWQDIGNLKTDKHISVGETFRYFSAILLQPYEQVYANHYGDYCHKPYE